MIDQDDLIQGTIDFEGRYHEEMYITISECKQTLTALEQKLVKNLAIPDVVLRSEQLINFLIKVREQSISSKTFEEAGNILKALEKIN